jgi:integrase
MNLIMRLLNRNGWWHAEINRKTRRSLRTRDEMVAQRRLKELEKKALAGKLAFLENRPPPRTLGQFSADYLEHSYQTKEPTTARADSLALRKLMAALGENIPLTQISRQILDRFVASLAQTVKKSSVNVYLRHLKAAFNKAVAWKLLKENPCQGIKELKYQRDFPRFLTREEVHRLLAAETDLAFARLWRFLILSGCRRREALQLTTRAIDWPNRRVTVGITKNHNPKSVVITGELADLLQEIPADVGRLFPWHPDAVSHHFQRTAARAGLNCRLHDLRHTYGSWLAMAGVQIHIIQKLMNHQDAKTTQIYAHLSQAHLAEAAEKVRIGE